MKHLLIVSLAGLVACSAAKQDVNPKQDLKPEQDVKAEQAAKVPLREFTEGNFGVTFNHPENIATEYDPHGGADRVRMLRDGTFIGGLRVLPPFPAASQAEFVDSAKAYYLERLKASSVEHRVYENPHRYKFDVFQAKLMRNGVEHLTERYMYRRERIPIDEAQAMLDSMFGVFQFEFIAPADEYPAMQKDIRVIVDTFRLNEPEMVPVRN